MTGREQLSAPFGLAVWMAGQDMALVDECLDEYEAAHRAEVLAEAADVILADAALRETEGETELAAYGRELARLIQPDTTTAKEEP